MKIIIGVPADLNNPAANGFFEAYRQLCRAISENDIVTFAPKGGDIDISASQHLNKNIEMDSYDPMSQYQNTLELSKTFADKIKKEESDSVIAFNSMGLFLDRPHIFYTSNVPYKRVLKLVENEYPKKDHFKKLLEYYKHVSDNEKENYLKADRIILFSHMIRKAIIEEHNIDPEKIIYLPRPIPDFNNNRDGKNIELENESASKKSMKIILMPAQLRVMKGIKYAIETMKILKTDLNNAVLVICGSINKYEEQYVKELLDEAKGKANIIVAGFLSKEDLYKYMRIADCAFMPFCFDECPIALTECIGHGLPVVTNEYAGYEVSVIDRFGYCAKHKDVKDYAKGLIRILTDEEFKRNKILGSRDVAQEFNFERFKEELLNVLK